MKIIKGIAVFIISLVFAYLILGYVLNGFFAGIKWAGDATIWDKLREYYIRTFSINIKPSFIIAMLSTGVYSYKEYKRG